MKDTCENRRNDKPLTSERLQTSFERCEGAVVVRIDGEMDFYSVETFKPKLDKVCQAGVINFIFDLNGMRYIDSTGLGFLVAFYYELKGKSGKLICIAPTNRLVQKTIEANRVGLLLELVETREEAVGHFRPGFPEGNSPAAAEG